MISIRLEDPDGAPLPAARPGQYLTLRIQPDERAEVAAPQLLPLGTARRRLLPDHRQARTQWRRQRLSAHPARRRRPTRRRSTTWHLHPRPDARARAADQRRDRRHPGPRHAPGAGEGAFRAGDLVAARRTQQSRPLVRRGGPRRSSRRSPTCAPTCTTAVPVRTTAKAATSTARAGSLHRCSPSSSHRAMPRHTCAARHHSWTRSAPALAAIGIDASHIHTEPFGPAPGLTPGIAATPARTPHPPAGQSRERPDDRVRPQQPRHPVEQRLREPARARRSLRRTRPLVVPHRRLPQLRDHSHRRRPRVQPRPGRTARRRKRAHLLLDSRATTWCSTCDLPMMRWMRGPLAPTRPRFAATRCGWWRSAMASSPSPSPCWFSRSSHQRRRGPAPWPPRALAVVPRLRAHLPLHRAGVGQPPRSTPFTGSRFEGRVPSTLMRRRRQAASASAWV